MTKRASETQIVKILEESRGGAKADEICRISRMDWATFLGHSITDI